MHLTSKSYDSVEIESRYNLFSLCNILSQGKKKLLDQQPLHFQDKNTILVTNKLTYFTRNICSSNFVL